MTQPLPIRSAFVTGATGLLGNNLVRLLHSRGVAVRALVRSREKAEQLFGRLPVELVTGDIQDIPAFSGALRERRHFFTRPPTSQKAIAAGSIGIVSIASMFEAQKTGSPTLIQPGSAGRPHQFRRGARWRI
jgi:uncharacterized protein YbjT (DUF2867 family)